MTKKRDALPNDLPPYPDFAQAHHAGRDLLSYLRGEATEKAHALHCAYTILGFSIGLAVPCPELKVTTGESVEDRLKNELEVFEVKGDGPVGAEAIPWTIILPLVFEIIKMWLAKR